MDKRLYTVISHWDIYTKEWEVVALLEKPQEIYKLIEHWESQYRADVNWNKRLNTFTIGGEKFKVAYAYRFYLLTSMY